jgi:hypothetical protein
MRDDTLAASQPPVPAGSPASSPVEAVADQSRECGKDAAPADVLCRDGAYPDKVRAVRKAVERNAAFGC